MKCFENYGLHKSWRNAQTTSCSTPRCRVFKNGDNRLLIVHACGSFIRAQIVASEFWILNASCGIKKNPIVCKTCATRGRVNFWFVYKVMICAHSLTPIVNILEIFKYFIFVLLGIISARKPGVVDLVSVPDPYTEVFLGELAPYCSDLISK